MGLLLHGGQMDTGCDAHDHKRKIAFYHALCLYFNSVDCFFDITDVYSYLLVVHFFFSLVIFAFYGASAHYANTVIILQFNLVLTC